MSDLRGSRFLVLGGSSGIGLAVAKQAFAEGARVHVASRSRAKLDKAVSEIGPGSVGLELDVTDDEAVASFFALEKEWDHVVVSAAETVGGPVRKQTMADARKTMLSKFWGAYHVARSARIRQQGSLCLVSGFRSFRPSASTVLQGAINAALEALARGLALELAPIRVNVVSPGLTATPMWSAMSEGDRASMFGNAAKHLPAGRVGQPEDIANAVLFLAKTPFATGSTVLVDGGGTIA